MAISSTWCLRFKAEFRGKPILISINSTDLIRRPQIQEVGIDGASVDGEIVLQPPRITAHGEGELAINPIEARFEKMHFAKEGVRGMTVQKPELQLISEKYGRWKAVIDAEPIIKAHYKDYPHGVYRAELGFPGERLFTNILLNLIYKLDWSAGASVFSESTRAFKVATSGIVAVNPSKAKTFVSIPLRQRFDFNTDFIFGGAFIAGISPKGKQGLDGPVLDITFDEKLSFLFGEDGGDSFSIKVGDEMPKKSGRESERNKIEDAGVFVEKDGKTMNQFQIRVVKSKKTDHTKCCLYLSKHPFVLGKEEPEDEKIMERKFAGKLLPEGPTQIRLRVWNGGRLEITDLYMAEILR
jgi:hypothetical protein